MPRINNKKDARTLTTVEKDTDYDLNNSFSAEYNEVIYNYDSQDEIVLWSQLCGKNSATNFIDGIGGEDYCKFAIDRSANGSDNTMFSHPDLLYRRFSESQIQAVLSLMPPDMLENGITPDSINVCGDPCMFFNMSLALQTDECDMIALGMDNFFIPHNSDLTHTNGTKDTPFSISLWYYPVDYENNPNRLYDRGGDSRLFSPTLLHKTFEYGLYIRSCGKLEFVLYDVDIDVNTVSISEKDGATANYAGSVATLTARSKQNVLKPHYWNHITITYDGSGTREGMNIYVNCNNVTNRSDVPALRSGPKTFSTSALGLPAQSENQIDYYHFVFMLMVYAQDDDEDPNAYTRMRTHSTPLVFASSAYVGQGSDLRTSSGSENNLTITPRMMQLWPSSQLPLALLFDFALWQKELDQENVIAVCVATRECPVRYSITTVPSRDSGYINLSPKILTKIRDEKQNQLSVIDRIGDRSDRRVKDRPPFNDKNIIFYGKKVKDEFKRDNITLTGINLTGGEKLFGLTVSGHKPNDKFWESQRALIKREFRKKDGDVIYDSALAFLPAGTSDSALSFIESKDYFFGAVIYYDLILGPYNQKRGNLNLSEPTKDKNGSSISVQIQKQGSGTWETIKTHTVKNEPGFFSSFYSPAISSGIKLSPNQHQFRRSFSISPEEINSTVPYKIRIMTSDTCWGLGSIEIRSLNQNVRPPLLIDHDSYAGKFIDERIIATPHTRSDLEVLARSISGISDTSIYFSDEETQKITPFKDNIMHPFAGKSFFSEGTSERIVSNFSSPLKDKTLFTIELNADSENGRELGFYTPIQGSNTDFVGGDSHNNDSLTANQVSVGQKINSSWHNKSSDFLHQKTFVGYFPLSSPYYSGIAENGIPFSTIDSIGSGSTGNSVPSKVEFYHSREVLSSYARPISSFGFPTSHTFFVAHKENLINMSDFITKPFLLEKVVLEFDSTFDFARSGTANQNAVNAYKLRVSYNQANTGLELGPKPSIRFPTSNIVVIPSYSLIKVSSNSGKVHTRNVKTLKADGTRNEFTLNYSTAENNYGTSMNRIEGEMITYGQITLFASGSNSIVDMQKVLDDGLARDVVVNINELPGQPSNASAGHINPFTASFAIETPVRAAPIVSPTQRIYMRDNISNFTYGVYGSNLTGGRSLNTFQSFGNEKNQRYTFANSSRGIINNFATTNAESFETYKLNQVGNAQLPETVKTSGQIAEDNDGLISPYILMPEDAITLCFHYPIPQNGYACFPGSTDTTFNKMKIGKNLKIHFYGSEIKESSEFHENINQALTTAQINEPIGCESVVDQYYIESKDEYYKTFVDRVPVFAKNLIVGGTTAGQRQVVNLETDEVEGHSAKRNLGKIMSPVDRIGLGMGSKVHHWVTYQVASASFQEEDPNLSHFFDDGYLNHKVQVLSGSMGGGDFGFLLDINTGRIGQDGTPNDRSRHVARKSFTFPFTSHYNNQKHYADSGKNLSTFVAGFPLFGRSGQMRGREKYIFSCKHFGYYSDMLDTSRDSKFKVVDEDNNPLYQRETYSKILGDQIRLLKSPVFTRFVTSSIDNSGVVTYFLKSPDSSFQTLNKTIDSFISSPYDDLQTPIFT